MAKAEDNTIILSFKRRLLPNKKQHAALAAICESQRQLYNGALEHRVGAYGKAGVNVTLYLQQNALTELRKEPGFSTIPANLQRWTLKRLDDAYRAFFRRLEAKEDKAGFPRFRGMGRWSSFGFSEFCGITLRDGRLRFKGLPGSLRIHLHRPLPESKPLSCTFTRDAKGWYVCLQYRVPIQPLPATGQRVGIDLGLTTLAMLSTGEAIANPRHTKKAGRELRRQQRALARCRRGSNRRKKVKARVTRFHAHVVNARRTYLHQVSARLVRENDMIAVEKLNVKGMAGSMLAKPIYDAGWSILKELLTYKAAKSGRRLVEVDPRNTSQACSGCGCLVPKTLNERWHSCQHCGLGMDRDHNAALNVLHKAVVGLGPGNVNQWVKRPVGNITSENSSMRVTTEDTSRKLVDWIADDSGDVVAVAIFGPDLELLVTCSDGRHLRFDVPDFYKE